MNKSFLSLILFCIVCFDAFSSDSYSILSGDTLKIGNCRIERVFLWNDGDLMTCRVIDKKSGKIFESPKLSSDFAISKGKPRDARLDVSVIESDGIRPSHLLTTVSYSVGDLDVERRYRIYDSVPAIAIDTRLRGQLTETDGKDRDNSDRSNIEHLSDMDVKPVTGSLDRIALKGNHWRGKAIEFRDITDWNDNLVDEKSFITYRKTNHRGNILIVSDLADKGGLIFLKEAPCSDVQLAYQKGDFTSDFGVFTVTGLGVRNNDVTPDKWTSAYSSVLMTFGEYELSALKALRGYQKQRRILLPERDEMIMMNTWGDRSQDSRVTEAFCLDELDRASDLGITVFQIDDGWQTGKSPNSAFAGGSFDSIYSSNDYWTPDSAKYPHGLKPIVDKGKELGVEIALWFNPSIKNDFADWEKDANTLTGLWKNYGIRLFKIDGLTVSSKKGEENLRKLFDKVLEDTGNEVSFNLDATASRRNGYHYFNEYGNIFLENRYTDWGNYYPYHTLRNLWMLSKYVPAEKLQIEFLNKWRNTDKYRDDPFAPDSYSFDYIFGITMAAQPLAWMEASNLPEEAFGLKDIIEGYKSFCHEFHKGTILPIGNEPSGTSWTGFQSLSDDKNGYLIIYRERNDENEGEMETWFSAGDKITLTPLLSHSNDGEMKMTAARNGKLTFSIDEPDDFRVYRYAID